MNIKASFRALTKFELTLWIASLTVVSASIALGGSPNWLTLVTSLVGVTALIFVSKGDVLGQLLTIAFSIGYGIISWNFSYYGEMITYLGMTAPIAIMSVISWLKNPYVAGKSEVKVAHLSKKQVTIMLLLTAVVTFIFYFILKFFENANLFMSTVSIATSFLASYLMLLRSDRYALAYAANDLVLISLWVMASFESISYLPMVFCFIMFFFNDMYGFFNWRKIKQRQLAETP